ncbi:MAG TPA: polyhydroxyalkanoate synthesis repressor PhaR [Acetobacteraceae bacterium]|jgi:polyhydroxyalkanoate synthesis repressor PhaR|nr:polyhydroxyalkanoate synthesis repressor PhaR [Acetobacteraceae bacterium]
MPDPTNDGEAAAVADKPPVVVKKYANRRLYNTESSSYITLDSLADMVRAGRDFVVYDAKSGDDITRSVLTQIIVEEESKGRALLPTGFLRQLIGFYGDSMQNIVPKYLENALTTFARQQQQMRLAMQQTMGTLFPFGNVEEMSRKNMAMMERAMSLFSPFYRPDEPANGESSSLPEAPHPFEEEIHALRMEVESLRKQLAERETAAIASPAPVLGQGPEQSPAPHNVAEPAQPVKSVVARRRAKVEPQAE